MVIIFKSPSVLVDILRVELVSRIPLKCHIVEGAVEQNKYMPKCKLCEINLLFLQISIILVFSAVCICNFKSL